MAIKLYVSLISCSQEVRKNQQRLVMILESKNIPYTVIDITDPCNEEAKEYMVATAVPSQGSKIPITPQIFNDAEYCGDFNSLDMANECDDLGNFLKLSGDEKAAIKIGITGILPAQNTDSNVTNGSQNQEAHQSEETQAKATTDEVVDIGETAQPETTETTEQPIETTEEQLETTKEQLETTKEQLETTEEQLATTEEPEKLQDSTEGESLLNDNAPQEDMSEPQEATKEAPVEGTDENLSGNEEN